MESASRLGDGRYEVRGTLGEGAQGVTYDAVEVATGRQVAVKRFDVRGAKAWKDVELAEREARVLASLDHPLVPRYIEHFEESGHLYLVMEKVEGETLDAMRRRLGPLPEKEVRRFLGDADRAFTYLHGRASPVVHRDVKPRNVIRRPDGSYVLVDFGAVAELMLRKGSSTIVGTMGYMAPEQFQGRAGPSTDVYAVGATALAALTGLEPEALPHQGLRVDVRAALGERTSPTLLTALEQMLEPDPDRRPKSLAAALDGVGAYDSSMPPAYGALSSHGSGAPPPRAPVVGHSAPPAHAAVVDTTKEDAQVKSIRGLLWVLWGIGWVLAPAFLSQFHAGRLVPLVMFSSLAALLIVTWQKGALIRAALRGIGASQSADGQRSLVRHRTGEAAGRAVPSEPPGRHRIEVQTDERVRVHTTEVRADELGDTEVETSTPADVQQARRR